MRKLLALAAALAALALPAAAAAHPLGNFTTNTYSRADVSGDRVYVLYVLDLAEIPTFQDRGRVRELGRAGYAQALARELAGGLELAVAGERRALRPLDTALAFPAGAGGLSTTRLEVVYDGGPIARTSSLSYRDGNFARRIGWREVVVRAGEGARLGASDAPAASSSRELRAYPENQLKSPLDVRTATASVVPGAGPSIAPSVSPKAAPVGVRGTGGGFAALVAEKELGTGVVLAALALALFWGAAHALSPGHGKAIVAAYLVGTRGKPRHALYLGLIVTITHTAGVFTLGGVTLALSEFVVPEQLYPWLNLVSALLVVAVGLTVLRSRVRRWLAARAHRRSHDRGHHHDHDHGHHHHHVPEPGMGVRGLLAVGVSGGIIPCPTALVVLLAAISLHRVGYGLVLIVAFSLGLAAAMTAIGLLAVTAKRTFGRLDLEGAAFRALPAVSALVIVALGLAMTARALPELT